jgi:hypothetical protein
MSFGQAIKRALRVQKPPRHPREGGDPGRCQKFAKVSNSRKLARFYGYQYVDSSVSLDPRLRGDHEVVTKLLHEPVLVVSLHAQPYNPQP